MTFLRLAGVIVLWFLALLLWNVSALRFRTLISIAGLARLLAGAAFMLAALYVLSTGFPQLRGNDLSVFAIGSFLAALVADFIIGDDLRSLLRR